MTNRIRRNIGYEHRSANNSALEVLNAPIQALSPFVEWSPDGATLATGAESIYFQLWSGVSGQPRNTDPLAGHVSGLTNAAFAPMGQTVVSASEDGTIRFWHFLMSRNIVEIAKLESKQMKFNGDMIIWEKKLMEIQHGFDDYEQGSTGYKDPVYWLRSSLDGGHERSAEYNTSEELLGLVKTDYYELDGLIEDYSRYYKLWDQVISFQEQEIAWATVPMHTVEAEDVEGLLDKWYKSSLQMIKDGPSKGGFDSPHTKDAKKVVVQLRDSIDGFKKKFPFLRAYSLKMQTNNSSSPEMTI